MEPSIVLNVSEVYINEGSSTLTCSEAVSLSFLLKSALLLKMFLGGR